LLKKYRIPVDHISFEYVEKCNDQKEMEKNRENAKAIIKIVISLFPSDSNLRKHFNVFLSILICSTLLFQQGRTLQYGDCILAA
jgi:hypothetical protein